MLLVQGRRSGSHSCVYCLSRRRVQGLRPTMKAAGGSSCTKNPPARSPVHRNIPTHQLAVSNVLVRKGGRRHARAGQLAALHGVRRVVRGVHRGGLQHRHRLWRGCRGTQEDGAGQLVCSDSNLSQHAAACTAAMDACSDSERAHMQGAGTQVLRCDALCTHRQGSAAGAGCRAAPGCAAGQSSCRRTRGAA